MAGKALICHEILSFWRKVGDRGGSDRHLNTHEFKVAIIKGLEHNVESLCRLGD